LSSQAADSGAEYRAGLAEFPSKVEREFVDRQGQVLFEVEHWEQAGPTPELARPPPAELAQKEKSPAPIARQK
jgi:hypothetical protein